MQSGVPRESIKIHTIITGITIIHRVILSFPFNMRLCSICELLQLPQCIKHDRTPCIIIMMCESLLDTGEWVKATVNVPTNCKRHGVLGLQKVCPSRPRCQELHV